MRALALCLSLAVSASAFAESRVYVLDGGGKTVARLDVRRGAIEAKASLPFIEGATDIVAAPDGKRLVVLSAGKRSNASAAIVDAATLTVSSRIDLGRGVAEATFARDGKSVFVLSPGSGEIPGALQRIDLAKAAVSKRLSFDRVVDQFGVVGDDTGVVFQKGGKYSNGRLFFVSLDTLELTGTLDLTGKASQLVEIPGSGYLYAVEPNAVEVFSIADRKAAGRVTVGNDVKLGGVDEATRSLFVLGTNDQKNGMLYV